VSSVPLTSKLTRERASALILQCSDHRFQAGFHEFLNLKLDLNHNYALLSLPGGPQSLTLVEYLPKFAWAGWKWFRFLVERVEVKRMILMAHQDCLWYKELPFHLRGAANLKARQLEDLRRARQLLEKEFPHLSVELFYVGCEAGDRIAVESIPS